MMESNFQRQKPALTSGPVKLVLPRNEKPPYGNATHGPSISAMENGATTRVFGVERKAADVHQ